MVKLATPRRNIPACRFARMCRPAVTDDALAPNSSRISASIALGAQADLPNAVALERGKNALPADLRGRLRRTQPNEADELAGVETIVARDGAVPESREGKAADDHRPREHAACRSSSKMRPSMPS